MLSNELEGTSDYFYPEVSNYAAVYTGPTESSATLESPPEEEVEPAPTPEPTPPAEVGEVQGDSPAGSSARTVLHRVLTPHRGFALTSHATAAEAVEVIALKGDTRDTVVIGSIALSAYEKRIYYTTQSTVSWTRDDGASG